MRGISPVIATVLLLVAAVGISVAVITWLKGTVGRATEEAGKGVTEQVKGETLQATYFYKDSHGNLIVHVKNVGSEAITIDKVQKGDEQPQDITDVTVNANSDADVNCSPVTYERGVSIYFIDANGNRYGPFVVS